MSNERWSHEWIILGNLLGYMKLAFSQLSNRKAITRQARYVICWRMNVKNTLSTLLRRQSSVPGFCLFSSPPELLQIERESFISISQTLVSLCCDWNTKKSTSKRNKEEATVVELLFSYENAQHPVRLDVRSFSWTRLFNVFEALCPFVAVESICSRRAWLTARKQNSTLEPVFADVST